ncbi:zinc finger and BTB domain-containing protein 37 [Corythoichthys intestinalis]|uniref:zinc finger and BTB domain-containing protein 37 n=1 Tax=Corythoichthys intestinalis TaxID=161448 RepID=UPI0025A6703B|nr:zinc finger and BTB domain-containing protein 37 [Corythoichthys intestinalis]
MERSDSIQLDVPDFGNSVLSHLNQLRAQGRLCDIVVHVEGRSFRAHKAVLAASSPYFRDHTSLSQMSAVSLTVIRRASVFERLLGFCYTGRLRLPLRDVVSYLTAASFLQMQEVIDRCTRVLEGIHLKMGLADPEAERRPEPTGPPGPPEASAVPPEAEERVAVKTEPGPADEGSGYGDAAPVLVEHQGAESESPSGGKDLRRANSQGEEAAAAAYEDYGGDPAGERWYRYNPRLTCIYCCKSFNQKGSLDRHMRLHMGITPFACRLCGKKYTRKDQLEYHIRKHTGNKPFTCRLCAKSFPFQAILNQHLRKNHPGHRAPNSAASPETTSAGGPSPGREDGAEGPRASATGPD